MVRKMIEDKIQVENDLFEDWVSARADVDAARNDKRTPLEETIRLIKIEESAENKYKEFIRKNISYQRELVPYERCFVI